MEFKQQSGYWMRVNGASARWQKDFHDHIIRKYEDLKAHILYVLENPVRKGLVEEWQEYPFSGCVGYESLEAVLALL